MIRKSIFALAAIATVATVSFASSPAEARRWHGYGWGLGVGAIVVGAPLITSCVQYQWIETRRGWRQVAVNVC